MRFLEGSGSKLSGAAFVPAMSLRVLDLSECSTKRFPDAVGQLKQLRYLNASMFHGEFVPECITKLSNLIYLNLHGSNTSTLPKSIGELEKLMHHYRKTVFCRVPESSPCALFRAHDEDLLCRVSPEEHTAKKKHPGNLTLRRVPRASTRQTLIFAVCQPVGTRRTWITCGAHPSAVRGPHGRYCLPCARARHTANSHLRRVPVG